VLEGLAEATIASSQRTTSPLQRSSAEDQWQNVWYVSGFCYMIHIHWILFPSWGGGHRDSSRMRMFICWHERNILVPIRSASPFVMGKKYTHNSLGGAGHGENYAVGSCFMSGSADSGLLWLL
jgi:hypothetical protein